MTKSLSSLMPYLESRAASRGVISYNKLAREFGQPKVTPESYRAHPFYELFGKMDDEDIRNQQPMRTSLVYSEVLNRPGHGFFKTLEKRRGYSIPEEREPEEWVLELDDLQRRYKHREDST